MKNKRTAIATPLLVSVILFLIPISEKLLQLTVDRDSNIILSASAVQLFIFAVPVAFYCKIRGLDFFERARVKPLPLSNIPFVIASAFTYLFTAIIILYIEFNFLSFNAESVLVPEASSPDGLGLALAYVIVPAIAEEFFFRSIIISDYSEYNGVVAITVSALFFAMLHFSFVQFPLYFLLGIILAMMTYVTGSSFPAMVVHLINNGATVFFGSSISAFLKESSSSVILAFILVVAFMASIASMLSTMENIYEKRSILYQAGELPGSRRDAVGNMARAGRVEAKEEKTVLRKAGIFLSPTFLLTVFLFILITFDII